MADKNDLQKKQAQKIKLISMEERVRRDMLYNISHGPVAMSKIKDFMSFADVGR